MMSFLKPLLLSLIFLFLFSKLSFADENFDVTTNAVYEVQSDNKTKVTKNISILNKKEFVFSPNYTISFGFTDIKNIQVYNANGSIPFDYDIKDGNVTLTINFNNPPKGVNSVNAFSISFETDEIVDQKGDVFEVDIPGISDPESFTEYNTSITVPDSYPELSIVKPNLPEKKDLSFSKEETKGAGIVLIFGGTQYYDLKLDYNISNPNLFPIVTEIALPPDTNYQKTLINSFSQSPESVSVDGDGNWIAKYKLSPRERKIITVKLQIRQNSKPSKSEITEEQIKEYTKKDNYWEATDSRIRKIAAELQTPENIYNYVVNYLSYNFAKVSSSDDRQGALGALDKPQNSVCLEYSDLLVALFRSAGVPARSIEGFAYTRNSKLRPATLEDDILHAWVEYYDFEEKTWIMIDPTWGSTTRGIDYFSNLDLDHLVFVRKGLESSYPIPAGGYKFENRSKDIGVSFSKESEFIEKNAMEISDSFPRFSLAGVPISGFVTVKNIGNNFIVSKRIEIINEATGQKKEYEVKNIPPSGSETFLVSFDTHFLTNSTHTIKISVDNGEKIAKVRVSFIPDLNLILIGGGIFVAAAFVSFIAVKTGRVYLQRRKK